LGRGNTFISLDCILGGGGGHVPLMVRKKSKKANYPKRLFAEESICRRGASWGRVVSIPTKN